MLTDKISVFKNFQSEPKTITLGQWLKVCKEGSRYAEQVLQYRRCLNDLIDKGYSLDEAKKELENNGKDQLKTSLPLATVGAVCKDARKLENVVTRTGWIALDIDAKDNPHLTDAEHLRDEVAKIKNVAFSGLSTGGRGVWALVKVSQPKRQAEHFEALQADFKAFGITLDSSKGKNPNDARFYSYDPGAIIKDSFTVYKKLPPEKVNTVQPRPPVQLSNDYSRYAESAFRYEIEELASAPKGERNNTLFKATASLAGLVAGGMLKEYEVKQALEQTALSIGLKSHEVRATINSGFDTGTKTPRTQDSISRNSERVNYAPRRDSAGNGKYESQNSAPNGFNPYTGEIFDNRGYPASWDEIEAPEPGTAEYAEAEYYRAMDADPILKQIDETFEPELITEP
ncbi:BT4734/BF3469 family protein [Rhodohalobacter halophilus]|uniref:BT4734/BF3469 family protein n=1 Tax=Rhodohalobacter halophilus TaxID=1812810 RepID=UPI00083F7AB7|nr:BT4734/BF3469 family protein [Rhodohalobacter halophilus]